MCRITFYGYVLIGKNRVARHGAGKPREGEQNITAGPKKTTSEAEKSFSSPSKNSACKSTTASANTSNEMSNAQLKEWIYQEYLERASRPGFKDKCFAKDLVNLKPDKKKKIYQFVSMYDRSS
jgi:hypothetical protein